MNKVFFSLLVLFLFSTPLVNSSAISQECDNITPYDYDQLMKCEIASYASSGSTFYQQQVQTSFTSILETTKGYRVNVSTATTYLGVFNYLFIGFLVIITALTGYQFMVSSDDPVKREEAKRTFKYILISGVLLAMIPLILASVFNLSNAITNVALGIGDLDDTLKVPEDINEDPGQVGVDQEVERFGEYYAKIPSFMSATKAYVISMNARHLLLLLLISISPLILLSYIYAPLRSYGKLLLYLFGLELFYPAIAIIILHFSLVLTPNLDFSLLTSALLLSVIFHAILLIATILKATMQVITSIRIAKDTQ